MMFKLLVMQYWIVYLMFVMEVQSTIFVNGCLRLI